jgi:serine/threonine protein kinase/WD40 repeat protein
MAPGVATGFAAVDAAAGAGAETALGSDHGLRERTTTDVAGAPRTIGPYHIERPLGEGGMGVVYLAEQLEPIQRRVALKVIKLGMDTREVVARFEAERQTLALMDHPNIASVLDAGATPDGRPYFVMEYVAGVPITEYCDAHALNTRQRVALFLQVCTAVQHAHQKGIIHRDLKPSNVLVTEVDGQPVPKVIDFGIAKATDQHLTEKTIFTQHGLLIGTPEYMSPEQADPGTRDIDTRTDIYSLGVILYELLAGAAPFESTRLRQGSFAELQRIIREEDPARPSTRLRSVVTTSPVTPGRPPTTANRLPSELSGDLDWITLKALEKDRARRYATVSELAADITRYLHHEPVVARPPSVGYRVQKFVRRNRVAVAAASIVAVAVLAGLVVSSVLYVREGRARREAVSQRERADAASLVATAKAESETRQRAVAEKATAAETRARTGEAAQRTVAEQALATAETNLYFNNIDLAEREVALSNIDHVDQLLRTCPVFLRSWEWHYLSRVSHMERARLDVPGGIASIALSADGARLFAGTGDMVLNGWDLKSRRLIHRVKVDDSNGRVDRFLVSADGASIVGVNVSAGSLRRVEAWDGATGRRRFVMAGSHSVALSADGRRLATATRLTGDSPGAPPRYTLKLWDAQTGADLGTIGDVPAMSMNLLLSADGTRLAIMAISYPSGRQDIRLVEPGTGRAMTALAGAPSETGAARETLKFPAAFSADGTMFLAAGDGDDGPCVKVWSTIDGREASTIRVNQTVRAAGFTADARSLVLALEDHTLRILDRATGAERQRLAGHADAVTDLAFASGGASLASAGSDNTVRVWSLGDGPPPATAVQAGSGGVLFGAEVSSDRRAVVSLTTPPNVPADGRPRDPSLVTLDGWDLATGRHLFTVPPPVGPLSLPFFLPAVLSANGSRLAVPRVACEDMGNGRIRATYSIRVLDAMSGRLLATLEQDPSHGIETTEQVARKRRQMLLSADMDIGAVGDRVAVKVHHMTAADGRSNNPLASYSIDIDIWDVATRRRLTTIPVREAMVSKVVLSPDRVHAALVVLGASGQGVAQPTPGIRLYEIATGRMARLLEGSDEVEAMTNGGFGAPVFSRDGKSAAAPLHRAIGIWDVATGRKRCSLPGTGLNLLSLAFSPDGTRLVSAFTGGTVTLWNALTGRQIVTLRQSPGLCTVREVVIEGPSASDIQKGVSIAFSDDGRQIVQTTTKRDPKGMKVQITTWDGSPRQ